jgi:hypothetical protein
VHRYRDRAGGPSFREVAKGWEALLPANVVLVLASSPVHLGLVGAVGIEIATPFYKALQGKELAPLPLFKRCHLLLRNPWQVHYGFERI